MANGMTFVFTNDYNTSVAQLIALLKAGSIPADIVLSKYTFIEMAHLQYLSMHGDGKTSRRAQELLRADKDRMVEEIGKRPSDVVGFSVTTDSYQWNLAMASEIKKNLPGRAVIMGGAHPTFVPERVIARECVDAIAIGEVDGSIIDIYRVLAGLSREERVPGLWFKKDGQIVRNSVAPLVEDLDGLPVMDIGPFVKANPALGQTYIALTARGCPFNCSYCNASTYKKVYGAKYLRKRSAGSVMAELAEAKKRYAFTRVLFVDDVFTMDRAWLGEFLPEYKKRIGLPYYCLVHPDMVDEGTISLLKETGCDMIKCGIQSVNPVLCKTVYNRALNLDKIKKVIRLIQDAGIAIKVDFIIGAPTETERDLRDLIAFIDEVKVDDIFLYFLKYYPGSRVIDFARRNGYITAAEAEAAHEGTELAYQIIPERFQGATREMYAKYNALIRGAAKSKFSVASFDYLLA